MEDKNTPDFNGPIPGSSLTNELGSTPDERPPEFADPSDAYEDMASRIATPDVFERISVASELGIPVELTVRSMVFSGWANGRYSADTMYLIYGPLFELTMAMLDEKGISYLPLAKRKEDKEYNKALDLLSEIKGIKEKTEEVEAEVEEEPEEETKDVPTGGLMGRVE